VNKALVLKPLQSELLFFKANVLEYLKNYNGALRILATLKQTEKSPIINEAYTRIKKLLKENTKVKEPYVAWMRSLGSKFNKIALKTFATDYRGIVAINTIAKGEVIISVPKNAIITVRMGKETNIGKKVIESNTHLIYPNNSLLSVYVLLEKANPKTKWKYLIESLPKSVSNFPLFFNKKERALLTGSPFLSTHTK
jgi:16S rRNA C1402 (ribose-2'-O) methylase RsmI